MTVRLALRAIVHPSRRTIPLRLAARRAPPLHTAHAVPLAFGTSSRTSGMLTGSFMILR